MSPLQRMVAWVHRSHAPTWQTPTHPIDDLVVCDDCCQQFATLAQYHFHHCKADE
jgi:hypothetical protein